MHPRGLASYLLTGLLPGALLALGVLLRLPAVSLPLGPDDAILAVAAEELADERWPALEGHGPLLPLLLVVSGTASEPAGGAVRWFALACGALLPVAWLRVARRCGLDARAVVVVGLLLALHPLAVAHAGGARAGTQGLALLLLLGVMGRFMDPRAGTRRGALALLLLAPLAWPSAWVVVFALAPLALRAEVGLGARLAWGGLAGAAVAFGVLGGHGGHGGHGSGAALLLIGLPVAALVVPLPLVVRGAVRLWTRAAHVEGSLVAWLAGAALHVVLLAVGVLAPGCRLAVDGLAPCLFLAPALLTLAGLGLTPLRPAVRRRYEVLSVAVVLPCALLAALPGVSSVLGLGSQAEATALNELRAALRVAVGATQPEGWVALDLGEGTATQARAARAWLEGRELLTIAEGAAPGEAPEGWPQAGVLSLALVSVAPLPGDVTTLGGLGIFAQRLVGQYGRYHVLRVTRP